MRIESPLWGGGPHGNGQSIRPETFRLPKPGQRDPYFNLSRSAYYELEAAGAIRSIRLRKRGNMRGITLIPSTKFSVIYVASHRDRRNNSAGCSQIGFTTLVQLD